MHTKTENSIVKINNHAPMGAVLFCAYIGAVVYFFNQSPDFWGFILALLKAFVWPAFVLYHTMVALGV